MTGHGRSADAADGEDPGGSTDRADAPVVETAPTLWEDRYGPGSFERLLALLERPCVSFARIAAEFGVSRERVRQWHRAHRPEAPTGQERRRLCRELKARRRLLADDVFGALHQAARAQLERLHVELLPAAGGFRERAVRINGWIVALCDGRGMADGQHGRSWDVWTLNAPDADFFFVWFGGQAYLLLPRRVADEVLRGHTLEHAGDLVVPFRNRLDALTLPDHEPRSEA
ncbi:MAG: hypothetical protein ABS36_14545 [Acidobacteria bacterium SCN 69-37]|nr:MAG: hypothetical protein ABS36_14545 [Acidobacteria bacterium SCN 69-37]